MFRKFTLRDIIVIGNRSDCDIVRLLLTMLSSKCRFLDPISRDQRS